MLEVAPNSYVVKNKIIGMKLITKDNKFWVVFNCGRIEKEEQSVFSGSFPTEQEAKAFLDACANSL